MKKPKFNPSEAAARMFISTQGTQDTQEDAQEVHDAQDTQSAPNTHYTQSTQDTQKTQRVQKHPRINMAFYGDNLDYVREEAWKKRMSVTEYVNELITKDRYKA